MLDSGTADKGLSERGFGLHHLIALCVSVLSWLRCLGCCLYWRGQSERREVEQERREEEEQDVGREEERKKEVGGKEGR